MRNVESRLTSTVVIVRPDYFGFNDQTSQDNVFQQKTNGCSRKKWTNCSR